MALGSPLQYSYPDHTPVSDELKLQPNAPRTEIGEAGSKSLLTFTPSIQNRMYPVGSDLNHLAAFPSQTMSQPSSLPLFPWLDPQQPGTVGRTCQNYGSEQHFTPFPIQDFKDNHGYRKSIRHEMWSHQIPQGSGQSSLSSTPSAESDYQSTHDFTAPIDMPPSHLQRPLLPLSGGPSQRHCWRASTNDNNVSESFTNLRLRASHHLALNRADSDGRSTYTTASNMYGTSQPNTMFDDAVTLDSYDSDCESVKGEPPYAKLIYQALMEVPDHKLVLRDIYAWISNNTDKAKDPAFKGWQNSVRHNLSMNGAFKKVPYVDPLNKHKKGYIWVLESSAIGKGIESTTRYRQKTAGKRSDASEVVDPKRQSSGRKGGRAARKSAKLRRSAKLDNRSPKYTYCLEDMEADSCTSSPTAAGQSLSPDLNFYSTSGLPYYLDAPTPEPRTADHSPYIYTDIASNDQMQFSNLFQDEGDFLNSKVDDLFGGQETSTYA